MNAEAPENKKLVLIVEDDADHAAIARRLISELDPDLEIDFAEDGDDALIKMHANRAPDLVLMDINMPKKNGIEALREIRAAKEFHDVPVVMWTTSESNKDVVASYQAGCNAFISKSSDFAEISERIELLIKFWIKKNLIPKIK